MESKAHESAQDPFDFLGLPVEIRHKIYRICSTNPRTIGDSRGLSGNGRIRGQYWDWNQFSTDWRGPGYGWGRDNPQTAEKFKRNSRFPVCRLSAQLLATCKHIYHEGIGFLYELNTFGHHIYFRRSRCAFSEQDTEIEARFFEGREIDELHPLWPTKLPPPRGKDTKNRWQTGYQFGVDKIRRLRLVIDLDCHGQYASRIDNLSLKHTLHRIIRSLQGLRLQNLNIDLQSRYTMTRFCILDPFMMLRKLRQVTFEPEPENPYLIDDQEIFPYRRCRSIANLRPQYAAYLEQQAKSSAPLAGALANHFYFQTTMTYLKLMKPPWMLVEHLMSLRDGVQSYGCFEGPFEVCKHRANNNYKQPNLHDDSESKTEREAELLNDDEMEGCEVEWDEGDPMRTWRKKIERKTITS